MSNSGPHTIELLLTLFFLIMHTTRFLQIQAATVYLSIADFLKSLFGTAYYSGRFGATSDGTLPYPGQLQ